MRDLSITWLVTRTLLSKVDATPLAMSLTRSTVQSKDFADFFRVVEPAALFSRGSFSHIKAMSTTTRPSITHQQLELLWRTFDKASLQSSSDPG